MKNIFIIILIISSFIGGVSLTCLNPTIISSVFAWNDNYYQTSLPPIIKQGDYIIGSCDWLDNNCNNRDATQQDGQNTFDTWCYSVINQYSTGKTVQVFRTMSHDCTSYIIDEKLKPLNDKIDELNKKLDSIQDSKK